MDDPTLRAAWLDVIKAGIGPFFAGVGAIAAALVARRHEARTGERRTTIDTPSEAVKNVRADDPQSMEDGLVDLAGVVGNLGRQMTDMRTHYEREYTLLREKLTTDMQAQEERHTLAIDQLRRAMQAQIDRGLRRIQQLITVMQAHNIPIPPEPEELS